jgi:hypothetical protein
VTNDAGSIRIQPLPAHSQFAHKANRPKDQKPHLNKERAQIEGAHEADQDQSGGGELVTGIIRTIAADPSGLNQGKPADIQDRAKHPAKLEHIRIAAHRIQQV